MENQEGREEEVGPPQEGLALRASEPDLSRLPKWAQEIFRDMSRQRAEAIKSLREWTDSQTPQSFYVDEWASIEKGGPTTLRRYFEGQNMFAVHKGVKLEIHLRDNGIAIWWEKQGPPRLDYVGIVPTACQQMLIPAQDQGSATP